MMDTLADQVNSELRPGEFVLWSGRGDPSVVFNLSDAFLVPFTLLWEGFAVLWTISAVSSSAGPFFVAFGSVFNLVGLYFVVGRFFVKTYRKRNTAYAVTNIRAFLKTNRTTIETGLGGTARTTTWSRNRELVTVTWNSSNIRGFLGLRSNNWPGNSGMDGFGRPLEMAFYDVRDGAALLAALNQASSIRSG
ncbi:MULTISPECIES: hypothetical protein [unclassified Cryobacterium]|uniref:hypothetical protein n=1 Tax=unclassified Cryobacterium TaxID=2649013 RepID=UPI001069A4D4|nr:MULTISPECIES: hypothetical protein [unclassified Cryobacterium]TFC06518.1 hypothetical protein E3O59_10100 [Cryobacterium sp. MDB2-33-2]TFC12533.1 hypothetical protein E3O51_18330 [Cryobacterium sp. MDB2-10]